MKDRSKILSSVNIYILVALVYLAAKVWRMMDSIRLDQWLTNIEEYQQNFMELTSFLFFHNKKCLKHFFSIPRLSRVYKKKLKFKKKKKVFPKGTPTKNHLNWSYGLLQLEGWHNYYN